MPRKNATDEAEKGLMRHRMLRDRALKSITDLHAFSINAKNDPNVLMLLPGRMHALERFIERFNNEQSSIVESLIDLDRGDEFDRVDSPLSDTLDSIHFEICDILARTTSTFSTSSSTPRVDSGHALPKIQLPKFDGCIIQWRSFRDTFTSLVHQNSSIDDITRFHYLLSCVSGSAASIVKSVPLSAANYPIAWKALTDRFENQRLLATAHVDQLFSFKPIAHESLSSLTMFVNTFQENIAALKALGVTDLAGFLLFYIGSRVLDPVTRQLFENVTSAEKMPDFDTLIAFVQHRCQVLENVKDRLPVHKGVTKGTTFSRSPKVTLAATTVDALVKICAYCDSQSHPIYRCFAFKKLNPNKRKEFVTSKRLCYSCLSPSHMLNTCSSKLTCSKCGKQHHTLLHYNQENTKSQTTTVSSNEGENKQLSKTDVPVQFSGLSQSASTVVLGTAIINVSDCCNVSHPVRVLLDSGSQVSVITSECALRLNLPRRKCFTQIIGLSQNPVSRVKGKTAITFTPHHSNLPVISSNDIIVLPEITGLMPAANLPSVVRKRYQHLLLADPKFDVPSKIDILIGGDLFPHIMRSGAEVIMNQGFPSAFDTVLGWVIVGSVDVACSAPPTTLSVISSPAIETLLSQFWSIEEPGDSANPTTEDELCDKWFSKTVTRDEAGRFSVAFPFREKVFSQTESLSSIDAARAYQSNALIAEPNVSSYNLGNSYTMAVKRFLNLEHRLIKDAKLYTAYRDFMDEYISLGHMRLATEPGKYYIPHHAVVKQGEEVLKIRVVFDASASTTSGRSLNDILCVGPKLQSNIDTILLKSRLKKYVFTADIVKMYRQIMIRDEDCSYQHVLWRRFPTDEIQDFELRTVTYGVSSAPYLAIRCLHELDKQDSPKYPHAKGILTSTTYVDDIIAGADTESDLQCVQRDVIGLLRSGACTLKKWSSNSSSILKHLPAEDCAHQLSFDPRDDHSVKVLGLHWDTHLDAFAYHTNISETPRTKRGILSTIAKLFDPIGALGPTIIWAKCIMQQLWQKRLDWDELIPDHIRVVWDQFVEELPLLRDVSLPRHIDIRQTVEIQLIGFSDASQKAYAATSYLRVVYEPGDIRVFFLACKTKVAPLKAGKVDPLLSIPRLELCGALLLSQLLHHLRTTLSAEISISKVYAWTDSTTVLSWLKAEPKNFKVFVTNRIAKIHNLLPDCEWNYVATSDNPADPSSRGLLPSSMIKCSLHWSGPSFLCHPEIEWPQSTFCVIPNQDLPDVRPVMNNLLHISTPLANDEIIFRFSSLTRMQRSIAFLWRFYEAASKRPTASGPLTHSDLDRALMNVIRLTQRTHFPLLIKQLKIPSSAISPPTLAQLAPFIDAQGIVRVGGRLRYSSLSNDAKHPILLPKLSHLTMLLIRHYHLSFLHGGPKLILAMLSRKFWILSGRDAVRRFIFSCVSCTRSKASRAPPLMGDLPSCRVEPHRPFLHVGMDYGGPFTVRESRKRNSKTAKVYLALFICMSVKAVHLELVSDLTTDAFLAALDRFVSRRGIPSDFYSDNGTNYVGAARQLKAMFNDHEVQSQMSTHLASTWHFNPPAAPHFGGLWEAAIKSTKAHLRRVIGSQVLTVEEFHTLITRIEGILNSRPLTPMSSDPTDLCPLTPGHFLIGQPIHALPETGLIGVPMNRLNRWQLIRQCYQSFWRRWTTEYLSTLQGRQKWYKPNSNLQVNDLVIVEAPHRPPTEWLMGRVTEIHPGRDSVVRVATIRTKEGIFTRPVVKLVRLPIPE